MCIWTSKPTKWVAALGSAAILSGCLGADGPVDRAAPSLSGGRDEGLTRATVDGIIIAAPPGYCVDTRSSRGVFVLMSDCAALDAESPIRATPLVLAATVAREGGAALPTQEALDAYFATAEGQALLTDGRNAGLALGDSSLREGVYILESRQANPRAPLTGRSWRALFLVSDRLVSATLRELQGTPIDTASATRTLEGFADGVRQVNRSASAG